MGAVKQLIGVLEIENDLDQKLDIWIKSAALSGLYAVCWDVPPNRKKAVLRNVAQPIESILQLKDKTSTAVKKMAIEFIGSIWERKLAKYFVNATLYENMMYYIEPDPSNLDPTL